MTLQIPVSKIFLYLIHFERSDLKTRKVVTVDVR